MAVFEQPALVMHLKTYQILSMFPYQEMTFKISMHDGIKSASELPKENILEGLYKLNLRDSVQLQPV